MTEPTTVNPNPWRHAAERTLDLKSEQLSGKTANETARAQKQGALENGVSDSATSFLIQNVSELAEAVGGIGGGVVAASLSVGATLATLVQGFARAAHEGDQMNEAYRRDAATQAVLWLGADKLPADFVQSMNAEFSASGSTPFGTSSPTVRVINDLFRAGTYDEAKRLAESQVSTGRDTALRLGITSNEALDAKLRTDPNFASIYQHADSTGYRLGVQSVIYEAQHPALQGAYK